MMNERVYSAVVPVHLNRIYSTAVEVLALWWEQLATGKHPTALHIISQSLW